MSVLMPQANASQSPIIQSSSVPLNTFIAAEQSITDLGTATYPDQYAGLVNQNDESLDVYLTTTTGALATQILTIAGAIPVHLYQAPKSARNLIGTHDALANDWAALQNSGVLLSSSWPDFRNGTEDISVIDLTPVGAAKIDDAVGAANVTLTSITHDQGYAKQNLATRHNDTSPFNAGDFIADASTACTSGYGITRNGNSDILTAGHCFGTGKAVTNLDKNSSGSGASLGYVALRGLTYTANPAGSAITGHYDGIDSEVLSGEGSDLVFRGGNTTVTSQVYGSLANNIGDTVCYDGAYSGETCTGRITAVNANDTVYDTSAYGNTYAYNYRSLAQTTSNTTQTHQGDSGGPVFRLSSGNVYAVGTITAGDGQNNEYTMIVPQLNNWGASLNTTP